MHGTTIKIKINLNSICRFSSYRGVNVSVSIIKTNQLALYKEIIAVCYEIETINKIKEYIGWAESGNKFVAF